MGEAFDWSRLGGRFIVFDGPDGCGKTTQMELLMEPVRAAGVAVRRVREPGGTQIGEQIRDVLLATKNEEMDLRCEMLLYMASRAQLVTQQIRPALAAGELVLSDRFTSSTLAYQGGGGGLSVESILQAAEIATGGLWPDLTVVFDLSIEAARQRLMPGRGKGSKVVHASQPGLFSDRIEQRDQAYHERVRQGYLAQVERWPERYRLVDASRGVQEVQAHVRTAVAEFFGK